MDSMLPANVLTTAVPRLSSGYVVACSSSSDDCEAATQGFCSNSQPAVKTHTSVAGLEPCTALTEHSVLTAARSSWPPHEISSSHSACEQPAAAQRHLQQLQQHHHQHHQQQYDGQTLHLPVRHLTFGVVCDASGHITGRAITTQAPRDAVASGGFRHLGAASGSSLLPAAPQLASSSSSSGCSAGAGDVGRSSSRSAGGCSIHVSWPGHLPPTATTNSTTTTTATLVTFAPDVAPTVFPFHFGATVSAPAGTVFAGAQVQQPGFLHSVPAMPAVPTVAAGWPTGLPTSLYPTGADLVRALQPSALVRQDQCVLAAGLMSAGTHQQLSGALVVPAILAPVGSQHQEASQQLQQVQQQQQQLLRPQPPAIPSVLTPRLSCFNPPPQGSLFLTHQQQQPSQQLMPLPPAVLAPALQPQQPLQAQPTQLHQHPQHQQLLLQPLAQALSQSQQQQQQLLALAVPQLPQPHRSSASKQKHHSHQQAVAAAAGAGAATQQQQQQQQQQNGRRMRPPSPSPPCAPVTPPLPSAAGPEDWILHAVKVLGMSEPDTARLALHCWRRVVGLPQLHHASRLWASAVAGRNLYATACLWISIKLEEKRRAAPGGVVLSHMAATTPAALCSAELAVMNWLEWRPYDGYRLDESHLLVYM